jgi:hypothetical protein
MVRYDGPALANNEMDVKELAPALFAIGELIEESNRLLNGNKTKVAINVKAFKDGCLGVDLSLVQDIGNVLDMFAGQHITGAVNLLTLLGFAGDAFGIRSHATATVLQVITWLQSRPLKNVIRLDDGTMKLEVETGESLVTAAEVVSIISSVKARQALEKAVYVPLRKEGYDSVGFSHDKKNFHTITKDESVHFVSPPLEARVIAEPEYEVTLQILSAAFQESNKWRFTDGSNSFFAEIQDIEFLERVRDNVEAFSKDDRLHVRLKHRQLEDMKGITSEFIVVKVIKHTSAHKTYQIPFSDLGQNDETE